MYRPLVSSRFLDIKTKPPFLAAGREWRFSLWPAALTDINYQYGDFSAVVNYK
jgi:hypothetical protein